MVICRVNLCIQFEEGKYGAEKLQIWTLFTQCLSLSFVKQAINQILHHLNQVLNVLWTCDIIKLTIWRYFKVALTSTRLTSSK